MLNLPETRGKFFSVSRGVQIQGVKFNPGICYPLTAALQPALESMAAKGAARIYPEEMRFVSGAAYPVAKKEKVPVPSKRRQSASAPSPAAGTVRVNTEGGSEKPVSGKAGRTSGKARKPGRAAFAGQTAREFS
jgi:hypothetical protein